MYIEGPSDAGPRHFGFKKTDYLHNTSYGAEVLLIQNRDEKYESIPCFFFYLIDYLKKNHPVFRSSVVYTGLTANTR